MKYSLPPFNEKPIRSALEQKIFNFSEEMFQSPILGIALLLTLNLVYLYTYIKSQSVISLLLYLFLAYLVVSLVLAQLLNVKRNK